GAGKGRITRFGGLEWSVGECISALEAGASGALARSNNKFPKEGFRVAEGSETLSHPALGQLAWAPTPFHWSTEYRLPSRGRLDVFLEPYPSDRYAFLDRAAELFRWALDNEQRLFREALRADVLELYNAGWRQDGEPVLSEEEFAALLEWQLLK